VERNITLDYFKIFLSILVITLHLGARLIDSHPLWNWFISQGIARIAVPCFFIINGYYLAKKINDFDATKKYIVHLLVVYTTWFFLYDIFYTKQFTPLILLQDFMLGAFHLWYVISLIYGCILLFILKKRIKNDYILLLLAVLLFFAGIILEGMKVNIRNGLFMGFPFIFCGYYIKSNESLVSKIKDIYLIPFTLLCCTMLLIESFFAFRAYVAHDIYISLIILCPLIFILILKHSTYRPNNNYLMILGSIASAIYFIHPFIILFLSNIEFPYTMIRFVIVCLLSFISSIFIIYINRYIKIFV
jgi:surface polysaccharide O-acyltransferase-like enzyme